MLFCPISWVALDISTWCVYVMVTSQLINYLSSKQSPTHITFLANIYQKVISMELNRNRTDWPYKDYSIWKRVHALDVRHTIWAEWNMWQGIQCNLLGTIMTKHVEQHRIYVYIWALISLICQVSQDDLSETFITKKQCDYGTIMYFERMSKQNNI